MRKILILCVVLSAGAAHADVPPNLAPVDTRGIWRCQADYEDVPPFTFKHRVNAVFVVTLATGGTWFHGEYVEADGGISISEQWTIDQFGNGYRRLSDSNYGKLEASLEVVDGGVEFAGSYSIGTPAGVFTVPYTESLRFGAGRRSFTAESRVTLPVGPGGAPVPVVFQHLSCQRVGGAQ